MSEFTIDPRLLEMAQMMASDEPLHPDLVPYYDPDRVHGMGMLRHPLVYSVPFSSNAMVNKQYESKKSAVARALEEKNFDRYVFLHERPYRVDAFKEIQDELSDWKYWKILGEIWVDTENQHANIRAWKNLLNSKRPHRHYFMGEDETNLLLSLPDEVTIYRGCLKGRNENGLSWTLDKVKAEWFAKRLLRSGTPLLLTGVVKKSDIVAVLLGRNESEIVTMKVANITKVVLR